MPPKSKYTKEQIIDIAFEMVRKEGMETLTARSLASELKTSTAPIFTAFQTIEEVQIEIINKAKKLYKEYINEGLKQDPAFKGTGMKYIEFAKNEPQLFKLLFMSNDDTEELSHFMPQNDENSPVILELVKNNYGLDYDKAKKLYNHLSVYTHGLAVLYAQGRCIYTDEDVSQMLSEIFMALMKGE